MTAVVTAVFTPLEGHKEALVEAFRATMPGVHAEPGCELYAIHDADDGTITMIEKWTTRADLDAHSAGDAVRALRDATGPHVVGPAVVTIMTPIEAGTPEQGSL